MQSKWWLRGVTLCVWALVAACAVFWAMRLWSGAPSGAGAPVARSAPAAADPAVLGQLLGAVPATAASPELPVAAPLGSRFAVSGVIAQDRHRFGPAGLAVIAIDGKPARIYRVGDRVEEGYVLQSVGTKSVVLASDMKAPAALTLALPQAGSVRTRGNLPAPAAAPMALPIPGAGLPAGQPNAPLVPQISLSPPPLSGPLPTRP
jgi:general secretion pathway protein C